MLNRVVLIGRITRDVDMKMTSSQIAVTNFTLAVNRNYTAADGEKPADFINCVAWRNQAEFMNKYVRKGNLLGLEGQIQTRNYENQDGQRVYITEVVVDNVQLLERNEQSGQESYGQTNHQSTRQQSSSNNQDEQDELYEAGKTLVADEDLPF